MKATQPKLFKRSAHSAVPILDAYRLGLSRLEALKNQHGIAIPCAAHVPPRCRGEKKSQSKCQRVVSCVNKSIMQGSARCSKKHAKTCPWSLPKPCPARPQTLQNRGPGRHWEPKCDQEAPQTSQKTAKSTQEVPKMRPRSP